MAAKRTKGEIATEAIRIYPSSKKKIDGLKLSITDTPAEVIKRLLSKQRKSKKG